MPARLFNEHKAIITAAEKFLAALKSNPRPSLDEVSRLRVKLSALVRQHRTTEEEQIFAPLRQDARFSQMPQLEPLVAYLMREKVKYSEHVRKWSPQAIAADWEGYVAAVEERVAGVKDAIRTEEECIYSVVLALTAPPRRTGTSHI